METFILKNLEAKILKDVLKTVAPLREILKNICFKEKNIYVSDGKRAVNFKKDEELVYPIDGAYSIVGEEKVNSVAIKFFLNKQGIEYPPIENVMGGYDKFCFSVTISKGDIISKLIIALWEKTGRAIDVAFLEVFYKNCFNEKIDIFSSTEEKNKENAIMLKIESLNLKYLILPFKYE